VKSRDDRRNAQEWSGWPIIGLLVAALVGAAARTAVVGVTAWQWGREVERGRWGFKERSEEESV
jgi:hypothetical protein